MCQLNLVFHVISYMDKQNSTLHNTLVLYKEFCIYFVSGGNKKNIFTGLKALN